MSETGYLYLYGQPGSKAAILREAVHQRLLAHQAAGELPTNNRFILYELRQASSPALYGSKSRGRDVGARSEDRNLSDAVMWLRANGIVPWEWIVDETRALTEWEYADTIADYLMGALDQARIDCWTAMPPPLILCESRTFSGVLQRTLAAEYLCPVAATNGQVGGFLHTNIAPILIGKDRAVRYVGDLDMRGHKIEANTRKVLENALGRVLDWDRVALTQAQLTAHRLPVVQKYDAVLKQSFPAVEVEALGQGVVTGIVRYALDALVPAPLEDVHIHEQVQRDQMRLRLAEWRRDDDA